MAFTVTENIRENIPAGSYEVMIYAPALRVTQSGIGYISIPCMIRNDVQQAEQDKTIYYSLFRRREPSPADPDGFSIKQISQLTQACGMTMGKEYASLQDWLNDISGKCFIITINGYDQKGYPNYGWHEKTRFPECRHQHRQPNAAPAPAPGLTPIATEEVPF